MSAKSRTAGGDPVLLSTESLVIMLKLLQADQAVMQTAAGLEVGHSHQSVPWTLTP